MYVGSVNRSELSRNILMTDNVVDGLNLPKPDPVFQLQMMIVTSMARKMDKASRSIVNSLFEMFHLEEITFDSYTLILLV